MNSDSTPTLLGRQFPFFLYETFFEAIRMIFNYKLRMVVKFKKKDDKYADNSDIEVPDNSAADNAENEVKNGPKQLP